MHLGPEMPVDLGVPVFTINVDADGHTAFVAVGGTLHLVDLEAGTITHSTELGFLVGSYARSPIDRSVTVSGPSLTGPATKLAVLHSETLEVLSRTRNAVAGGATAFSRDGSKLLSSDEKVVSIAATDVVGSRQSLRLGDDGIGGHLFSGAVFTADESRVLIASDDGGLFVWNPSLSAAAAAACRMAGRDLTAEEWATYLPDREPQTVCPQ